MAKKKTAASVASQVTSVDDPNVILFQGPKPLAKPGTVQLHSFGTVIDKIFGRKVEDVKADFDKVSDQLNTILSTAFSKVTAGMKMDEVEIALGFTAEGKLAFIAQAGVEASVKVTFKRA
ncbi:MAG TPA: CU044_2847 family protein [Pseudacidobacterium sp.]|nr:CU044_2847 family protein [Pseudacidobacterium sp.]